MSEKSNGGAAFPSRGGMMVYVPETARDQIEEAVKALDQQNAGMTLRDYFAAKAMAALVTGSYGAVAEAAAKKQSRVESFLSGAAYEIADAMIEERCK